jgi:predicted RNase H-like HicB family nuclease
MRTNDDTDWNHPEPSECERHRSLYLYEDESTGQWVAYNLTWKISSVGETKQEAIENCREAMRLYFEDETYYWDNFEITCPVCDDEFGQLFPLKATYDDPEDGTVVCHACDTVFELRPKPKEE